MYVHLFCINLLTWETPKRVTPKSLTLNLPLLFCQALARHLLSDIRKTRSTLLVRREEKQKKIRSRSNSRRPRPDVTGSMEGVRQLACDILDLSQSDFNDIMSVTSENVEDDREGEQEVSMTKRSLQWPKLTKSVRVFDRFYVCILKN